MKKNIWQENGIPVLPKASLNRVCELIGCNVEDLITLCSYGMIWINRKIYNEKATATIICDKGFENKLLDLLNSNNFNSHNLGYDEINIDIKSETIKIKESLYKNTDFCTIEFEVMASGTYALRPLGYTVPKTRSDVDVSDLIRIGSHTRIGHIRVLLENKTPVPTDELFIYREDIENLYFSKINGEKISSKILPEKKEEGAVIDIDTVRITTKQTSVIVSLLKTMGITDDELKGSTPKLLAKLQNIASKNGVILPDIDVKTWREWLSREGVR